MNNHKPDSFLAEIINSMYLAELSYYKDNPRFPEEFRRMCEEEAKSRARPPAPPSTPEKRYLDRVPDTPGNRDTLDQYLENEDFVTVVTGCVFLLLWLLFWLGVGILVGGMVGLVL